MNKEGRKCPQIVKDAVRRLYEAKEEVKRAQDYYNEVKKKETLIVSNWMFSELPKSEKSFSIKMDEGAYFYTHHTNMKVTRQRRTKITWLIDKLRENIPKQVFSKCVEKTYTVNDMDGLIGYLKTCGANPKTFKEFIDVSYEVDKDILEQCYALGEINKKDVEGCYILEYGEPFLKLTEENG